MTDNLRNRPTFNRRSILALATAALIGVTTLLVPSGASAFGLGGHFRGGFASRAWGARSFAGRAFARHSFAHAPLTRAPRPSSVGFGAYGGPTMCFRGPCAMACYVAGGQWEGWPASSTVYCY